MYKVILSLLVLYQGPDWVMSSDNPAALALLVCAALGMLSLYDLSSREGFADAEDVVSLGLFGFVKFYLCLHLVAVVDFDTGSWAVALLCMAVAWADCVKTITEGFHFLISKQVSGYK